jgi:hypothetical protein
MSFSKALPDRNDQPTEGIAAFGSAAAAAAFAPLPPGIYAARVLKGEFCTTKAGAEAYRMRFEITDGEHVGKTAIRTWTFTGYGLKLAMAELPPFGLTTPGQLLTQFPEPGREYVVRLVVALQVYDGREINDIKKIDIVRVGESPNAKFLQPDLSEGGR